MWWHRSEEACIIFIGDMEAAAMEIDSLMITNIHRVHLVIVYRIGIVGERKATTLDQQLLAACMFFYQEPRMINDRGHEVFPTSFRICRYLPEGYAQGIAQRGVIILGRTNSHTE